MEDWLPRSISCLKDYSWHKFSSDLLAGITVGLVALPLAMAFAIASGVAPQAGLYCAIVAGFLISALGGSTTQIGGPTGAFVVVVYGIVARYGLDGLFMCTLMAGVLLVILGITGLGHGGEIHSAPCRRGFHEWHRGDHRQHADQGFLWPQSRQSSRRISGAHGNSGAQFSHVFSAGNRARRLCADCDSALHALCEARAGIHRRAVCGHGTGDVC